MCVWSVAGRGDVLLMLAPGFGLRAAGRWWAEGLDLEIAESRALFRVRMCRAVPEGRRTRTELRALLQRIAGD